MAKGAGSGGRSRKGKYYRTDQLPDDIGKKDGLYLDDPRIMSTISFLRRKDAYDLQQQDKEIRRLGKQAQLPEQITERIIRNRTSLDSLDQVKERLNQAIATMRNKQQAQTDRAGARQWRSLPKEQRAAIDRAMTLQRKQDYLDKLSLEEIIRPGRASGNPRLATQVRQRIDAERLAANREMVSLFPQVRAAREATNWRLGQLNLVSVRRAEPEALGIPASRSMTAQEANSFLNRVLSSSNPPWALDSR